MKKNLTKKIKSFWGEQAKKFGSNYLATVPDKYLKQLEIVNILKYIPNCNIKMADIGCGNGFSTIAFAKERKCRFTGIDYSDEMIKWAIEAGKKQEKKLIGTANFKVGDVLNLKDIKSGEFDVITTDRCLINLTSLAEQKKAIKELARIVKRGGNYIMCEDTQEGLAKLNKLRVLAGLTAIPNHWHNIYINEKRIIPFIKRYFNIEIIDNFGSMYYLASRIFNALASPNPTKPNYLSVINRVAVELPTVGNFAPIKIFFLKKK